MARQYSKRTIHSYCYWIKAYIIFSGKRRPEDMGEKEVVDFLTYLAVKRNVAPGTQALALNALAYLYNKYLQMPVFIYLTGWRANTLAQVKALRGSIYFRHQS